MLKFVREQMGLPVDEDALQKVKADGDAVVDQ